MSEKKRGRPKNPRVHVAELLDYLDSLPEDSYVRQNLTPDRLIIIRRYIEEMAYLEDMLTRLKADIDAHGEVEIFTQGAQQLRRANPSVEMYHKTLRTYRGLVNKINELLRGVEVTW